MTLFTYKMIAAVLIFIVSILAAYYPIKKNGQFKELESMHVSEALASGIFLGAAFFHMLPDSIRLLTGLYGTLNYPIAEAVCVFGFLFLLFLERLSLATCSCHPSHSIPYILTLTLIVHALTEGAALGIGGTYSEMIMLLIAILAHKGSETFALCLSLIRHPLPLPRIIIIIGFFALMTPLGIGLGAMIHQYSYTARDAQLAAALFNAFAAGTFLYISTLHHVHFHQHKGESQGMLEFGSLVLGAVTMAVISFWT